MKGFTLLELIIVIGILAVLAGVSVLVLNPAQLFAQARDTTRIEDMSVVRNAVAMYISSVSAPDMATDGAAGTECANLCWSASTLGIAAGCAGGDVARHGVKTTTGAGTRAVDGTGWVQVDLGAVSGGPALAVLPIDPTNSNMFFYSYACNDSSKTFEVNTNLESDRYKSGGPEDKESNTKDGGNVDTIYEIGTSLTL